MVLTSVGSLCGEMCPKISGSLEIHVWETAFPWNLCMNQISMVLYLQGVYLVAFALHRA